MLKIKEDNSNTIPMNQMQPLQVGIINDKITNYDGDYVMRTAATDKFEVMNLSEARADACWDKNATLKVQLLPKGESITIELFN